MPAFDVIVWIIEYDQALDDGAAEVKDRCEIGLPCADGLPACGRSVGTQRRDRLTDR